MFNKHKDKIDKIQISNFQSWKYYFENTRLTNKSTKKFSFLNLSLGRTTRNCMTSFVNKQKVQN